ncbi:MAG: hypothetical protein AAFZ18_20685 [Myxococcota bacterium]
MRAFARDGALFLGCVVIPCALAWTLEDPSAWRAPHVIGAVLFFVATLMVFTGLRLLLIDPLGGPLFLEPGLSLTPHRPVPPEPLPPFLDAELPDYETSSEIIHVEHGPGSARVVALLFVGGGPEDVHLLELDVTGDDLRPEVLAEAVAGVASGEPAEPTALVDRVGFASGWGLTLPCPKQTQ